MVRIQALFFLSKLVKGLSSCRVELVAVSGVFNSFGWEEYGPDMRQANL